MDDREADNGERHHCGAHDAGVGTHDYNDYSYTETTYDTGENTNDCNNMNEESDVFCHQLQYHEGRLEYDPDTNDTTHSATRRLIHHTYDPSTNTHCHTKIEQYYTTTYHE